jgi:Na+/phosphate symporter
MAGLQKLFMFMGLMLFGVTMMLEGFDRKRIK